VLHVISDYATFSSERVVTADERMAERLRKEGWSEEDLPTKSILSTDPPRHLPLKVKALNGSHIHVCEPSVAHGLPS
jgi:hypothetical protein